MVVSRRASNKRPPAASPRLPGRTALGGSLPFDFAGCRELRVAMTSVFQQLEVVPYGAIEANPECAADERVTDRDLIQKRQRSEEHEVLEIEIVAGIDAKSQRMREFRRLDVAFKARA